jgi:hypothetical protein
MARRRKLFRIGIHRKGELRRGSEVASCEVIEFTEEGFGLKTDLQLAEGEQVELRFDLTNKSPIHCTIEARHLAPHLGGRITAISPEHQKSLAQFIDQHTTINLPGL